MSPTPSKGCKNREYAGKLVRKDSGELVLNFPQIWMKEDGAGGWTRLENKLTMNNLAFLGSSIPSLSSAIPGCMQDMADSCKALGAIDVPTLTKPVLFSKLIQDLERHGLLKPSSPVIAPLASKKSSKESGLSAEHHAEVKKLVSKETKNTVSAPAISSPLDTTSDPILIDDPPSSSPKPDTKTVKESSTPQDHEALKLLGIEHAATKADNKKLKLENQSLHATILKLQNTISIEQGIVSADLVKEVSSGVKDTLITIGNLLVSQVGTEVGATMSPQTEKILSEVSVMHSVKTQSDQILSDLNVLSEIVTEGSEANNVVTRDISRTLDELKSHPSKPSSDTSQFELLSTKMFKLSRDFEDSRKRTDVHNSLVIAMLTEALKNMEGSRAVRASGSRSPRSGRSRSPRSGRSGLYCTVCKGRHSTSDCPENAGPLFCVRCLDEKHRMYDCPYTKEICSLCRDKGLGDLAQGHMRMVHMEQDSKKREQITRFIPIGCFKDWFSSKRTASD